MSKCTIYYGMSGSLKLTTIESLHHREFKLLSDNKSIFSIDEKYFNWSGRINDVTLAIHRLLTLKYLPYDKDTVIERGVTDNVFCVPNRKLPGLLKYEDMDIKGLVDLELKYIYSATGSHVIKKLLVMKDEEFITKKVLTNRFRSAIYPDLSTYMSKQDEYIEFTKSWNKIDEVIEITDAKDYITNTLKIDYNFN